MPLKAFVTLLFCMHLHGSLFPPCAAHHVQPRIKLRSTGLAVGGPDTLLNV